MPNQSQASFDDILALGDDSSILDEKPFQKNKVQKALSKDDESMLLEETRGSLKRKEREFLGLDKQILRAGFIVFEDYYSKVKMMDTPLFMFGMKLHRQEQHVEFFDADFCNTLIIKNISFIDKTLEECCSIINEQLYKGGYDCGMLGLGKLNVNFDLAKIKVRKDFGITMRFNSFENALKGF